MKDTKNHFLQHKFNFFTETFSVHKISGIAVSWKKIKTGKEQQKLNWNFSHFFYFLFHYVSLILWFPLYLIWFKSIAREHMLIVEYKNKTYNTIQYNILQYSTVQYLLSSVFHIHDTDPLWMIPHNCPRLHCNKHPYHSFCRQNIHLFLFYFILFRIIHFSLWNYS